MKFKFKTEVCKGKDAKGKKCKYTFMKVDFLAWRVKGYCSEKCFKETEGTKK